MTTSLHFDAFISYRRDGGEILARLIYELLKSDYRIFFDHESLSTGRFDQKLLDIIEESTYFLVLLSEGCLKRCSEEGDWFMKEISHALEHKKKIILLMTEDFVMPTAEELTAYPAQIGELINYHGYRVSIAYIDSVIARLHQAMDAIPRIRHGFLEDLDQWRKVTDCLEQSAFAQRLPSNMKERLRNAAIANLFDDYDGKILQSLLNTSLKDHYNVRPQYRYEIDISDGFDFSDIESQNEYFTLAENFSYVKKFSSGSPDSSFWISFVSNLDALDDDLKTESFFFSENLQIHAEDLTALSALSEEDKRAFYLFDMRVRININGKIVEPASLRIDESGIFARYQLPETFLEDGEELKVRIRFKIPQKKQDGYFFASISDPTFSPFIRFSYPEDELDVNMIPFFNRTLTAKESKIFDGLREIHIENEWVLPVSGAVFIITAQK